MFGQARAPIGQRILSRRLREVVHQRLHHEPAVGVAHRAPPQRGHGRLRRVVLHQMIRHVREVQRSRTRLPRPSGRRRPSPSPRTACRSGTTGRRACGARPRARPWRRGRPSPCGSTAGGSSRRGCRPRASRPSSRAGSRPWPPPRPSRTKSEVGVARRPKPPPRNCVWISTCSGLRPVILAAAPWSTVWSCVPVQISHLSAVMRTVQLSGSMGAWARYGRSYSASTTFDGRLHRRHRVAGGLGLHPARLRGQRAVGLGHLRRCRWCPRRPGPTRRRGRPGRASPPRSSRPRRRCPKAPAPPPSRRGPSAPARRRTASPCRRSTASARRGRYAGRGNGRPSRSRRGP